MPHLTLDISDDGPITDFRVGLSPAEAKALRVDGKSIPDAVLCRGLIDTGSDCTCVAVEIIKTLGVTPTGITDAYVAGNPVPQKVQTYALGIHIVHPTGTFTLPGLISAPGFDMSQMGIEALIGRDVLKNCFFFYNGAANRFAMAW
jgi:hypothetical protein